MVRVKNERVSIEDDKRYQYVEIGDVDVNTGGINYKEIFGVYVPNKNPLKLSKGDIIVSTVRTYRKGIGYINSSDQNIVATSAFLVFDDLKKGLNPEYLLAILRSDFFIEQILSFQNRGMYPRLDRETINFVHIPLPKKEELSYIAALQKSLVNKEQEIKKRYSQIQELIESELLQNQSANKFVYNQPTIDNLLQSGRMDAGYYSEPYKYKQFLIENYIHSAKPIKDWGYEIKRGQNLQESAIGKIIESDTYKPGFYKVIRPTDFSEFGTISSYSYLGNSNNLSILEPGDIVFSAEGTIGKCVLFVNPIEKAITNIHGIILNKKDHDVAESSYIACFLRFLRSWDLFEYLSVGGQGGSLAMQYWDDIMIPNFPRQIRNKISQLYCQDVDAGNIPVRTIQEFIEQDQRWTQKAGVVQIDESAKKIQKKINEAIDQLVLDKEVNIDFDFLSN